MLFRSDAIASAYQQRPDLLAERAKVIAAHAEVTHSTSAYFPTLSFEGEGGWVRAWGQQKPYPGTYAQTRTYETGLSLKWTIFDGLRRENRVSQAKAEEAAALASAPPNMVLKAGHKMPVRMEPGYNPPWLRDNRPRFAIGAGETYMD